MNRHSDRNMPEEYRRPHKHERLQAVEHMWPAWVAERQALATVRRFNAANGKAWFWLKIAATLDNACGAKYLG
jgi:hypothetical protein